MIVWLRGVAQNYNDKDLRDEWKKWLGSLHLQKSDTTNPTSSRNLLKKALEHLGKNQHHQLKGYVELITRQELPSLPQTQFLYEICR